MEEIRSENSVQSTHIVHEILFALYGFKSCFSSNSLGISELLHPSEAILLKRLLSVSEECIKLKQYITESQRSQWSVECGQSLYLAAFVEHLDQALQPYYSTIVRLESDVLKTNNNSLQYIWANIGKYSELVTSLNGLISEIKCHKSRGCLILQHLQEHLITEVGASKIAVEFIAQNINKLFLKHITHWLIYGDLTDHSNEFFIEKTKMSAEATPFELYRINMDMLPRHVALPLAQRILNAGQTVLFLRHNSSKREFEQPEILVDGNGIAGEKKQMILAKVHELDGMTLWNADQAVDKLVAEVTSCVTRQLWVEAVQGARLTEQLKAIKDYYLLGKGELFHVFISQLGSRRPNTSTKYREMNQILLESARKVCLKEETLQLFTIEASKMSEVTGGAAGADAWYHLSLCYNVPSPLQLIFTPAVMESYNLLFRFLLWLKRIEIRMVEAWLIEKENRSRQINRQDHLQRNLRFLLSNLQYYLHVNVLDSQFMVLEAAVSKSCTFDEIHKAHAVFLSNVLSQSFAQTCEKSRDRISDCVNQILLLCEEYCLEVEVGHAGQVEASQLDELNFKLDVCMKHLLKLLSYDTSDPVTQGLPQLLLRLNFNSFFSSVFTTEL